MTAPVFPNFPLRPAIRYPKSARPQAMTPLQVAKAYNFPTGYSGRGYTGAIIELGGGFNAAQQADYFHSLGLPNGPTLVSVPVAGGKNKSDGATGADGEVQLDIQVAGAIAYNATLHVYFAPNTDAGFLAAIRQARADRCNGITISWGGPENTWDAASMDAFQTEIDACRKAGIPVFCAAGDSGSTDSSGAGNQADFPASAPSSVGCGGTTLTLDGGGGRAAEVVWNDNPTTSATGGGVSKHFPGRQVPDCAGNADPDSGYEVAIDGQRYVIGGTSAVAPLMLGLHALLWEAYGGNGFDMLNLMGTNPQAFFDVTQGNNGGYRAGPGRDNTTGLGVPDGAKLLAALTSGVQPPQPPTPAPAPPPPPPAPAPGPVNPMADFPVQAVTVWGEHRHSHSHVEANAYNAIAAWAAEYGVSLPT